MRMLECRRGRGGGVCSLFSGIDGRLGRIGYDLDASMIHIVKEPLSNIYNNFSFDCNLPLLCVPWPCCSETALSLAHPIWILL